jgi:hypothetical protein
MVDPRLEFGVAFTVTALPADDAEGVALALPGAPAPYAPPPEELPPHAASNSAAATAGIESLKKERTV